MNVKSAVKRVLPARALEMWAAHKLRRSELHQGGRNPEDIFTNVYSHNIWGGEKGAFCSGSGSEASVTQLYVDWVTDFIRRNRINSVLDIGCGDFRVGEQLLATGITYIGADIVRPLVDRNNTEFGSAHARFVHLDAIKDDLPNADLCLIRQVLQHLSNKQVSVILNKLTKFRFSLISEHHPAKPLFYNLDKRAGPGVRVFHGSGVYLDKRPFRRNASVVLETPLVRPLVEDGEKIVTYLLAHDRHATSSASASATLMPSTAADRIPPA